MPKARYAAEKQSDVSLVPALILLLLLFVLYLFDRSLVDTVMSEIKPAAPPGFTP
jgi:hypothetical protein